MPLHCLQDCVDTAVKDRVAVGNGVCFLVARGQRSSAGMPLCDAKQRYRCDGCVTSEVLKAHRCSRCQLSQPFVPRRLVWGQCCSGSGTHAPVPRCQSVRCGAHVELPVPTRVPMLVPMRRWRGANASSVSGRHAPVPRCPSVRCGAHADLPVLTPCSGARVALQGSIHGRFSASQRAAAVEFPSPSGHKLSSNVHPTLRQRSKAIVSNYVYVVCVKTPCSLRARWLTASQEPRGLVSETNSVLSRQSVCTNVKFYAVYR